MNGEDRSVFAFGETAIADLRHVVGLLSPAAASVLIDLATATVAELAAERLEAEWEQRS